MSLHKEDYLALGTQLAKAIATEKDDLKPIKKVSSNNAVIVSKITPKNFWKNARFWGMFGGAIVAGASGDYVELFPILKTIGGLFF